jgi:transposase InsO family protein/ASC-1-like (ASCH) protein
MSFLTKYGVIEQTVINGLSRNRNGLSIHFEHIEDKNDRRKKWIKYSSITKQLKTKFNLPIETDLVKVLQKENIDKVELLIQQKLNIANTPAISHYRKIYQDYFTEDEVVLQYARNHCIFDQIQQLRSFSIGLNKIYEQYKILDDLIFETSSLKSFYHKLKRFEIYGHECFIHKGLGKTTTNRKLTENHVNMIIKLYKNKKQYSYQVIQEMLNLWAIKNGYSQVSVSVVKKVLADKYIQNKCKPIRFGNEWKRMNLDSFVLREKAFSIGEQWQMDGSRFQFPYLTKNGTPGFLVYFVVYDVFTRSIIGYSCGETENHILVINALKDAVTSSGYLPYEIIRDNSTCFKHEKFKSLEDHIAAIGTNIRVHKPDKPNEKGHVERFVGTFQSTICKYIDGYVGEGVKSKREGARPSRDVILNSLKTKNLRSRQELEKLLDELILEYNSKTPNKRIPPEFSFMYDKNSTLQIPVSQNEIALMFWSRVQEYTVRKSMIILTEGSFRNQQFQYIIYDEELILRLNGIKVIVCYQKSNRDIIKLFDMNERFICDLNLTPKAALVYGKKELEKNKLIENQNTKVKHEKIKSKNTESFDRQHLYSTTGSLELILIKTKGNDRTIN